MSTFGVEFAIGIAATVDEIEERVDAFYSSLSENFTIVSVDVAWDSERGSLSTLLGVSIPNGLEQEQLAADVASDAVKMALTVSGLAGSSDNGLSPSARVLNFA